MFVCAALSAPIHHIMQIQSKSINGKNMEKTHIYLPEQLRIVILHEKQSKKLLIIFE